MEKKRTNEMEVAKKKDEKRKEGKKKAQDDGKVKRSFC